MLVGVVASAGMTLLIVAVGRCLYLWSGLRSAEMVGLMAFDRSNLTIAWLIALLVEIIVLAVAATIHVDNMAAVVVKMIPSVVVIDGKNPVSYACPYGNHEIMDAAVALPLGQCQDISQFGVTQLTLAYIASAQMFQSTEIVIVDFIYISPLGFCQSQLVSHLVGQEVGLFACTLSAHAERTAHTNYCKE